MQNAHGFDYQLAHLVDLDRVEIFARGFEYDPETRHRHRLRIAETLARFRDIIRSVAVRLVDINGPRGGIDKRCRIAVAIPGARPLVVEARGFSTDAAVSAASRQAKKAVARAACRRKKRR